MEIIGIGLFLLVMFLITWVVIACNAPSVPVSPLPEQDWLRSKPFSECQLEYRVSNLLRENEMLKSELEYVKRSCRNHHQPPFLGCDHCYGAQVKFYGQTLEQQKMADMLSKAQNTAKQLVKDLSA
jgi:hypothetical protein